MKSNANSLPAGQAAMGGDSLGLAPEGRDAPRSADHLRQEARLERFAEDRLALWCEGAGRAALRPGAEGAGVACRALFSGISRGTERLVFEGRVPEAEWARMRAPFQEGDFPHPVKYGYAMVAEVAEGPMAGQAVFALHPHQRGFRLPEAALVPVPEGVPPARAVLAANMETALNVIWDSGAGPGDRIAVVGAGVVGALVGYLAARLPGAEVVLLDRLPGRAALADRLGCGFALPGAAAGGCDVVIHTSASAAGLETAIGLAGPEAAVVEASWYGAGTVPVALGGAFHSRRLRLIGSQVGQVPPARAPRWTYRRRLEKALELLRDGALEALISGETPFAEMGTAYGPVLTDPETLCHRIRY
ncbi:zinc-binding alcohol dehydrogenase [Tabrizicola sp. TH137]|uniref:zinc-dependent alcohol dehydrogenase n=1 Tax=Tabrizicola sp. TH137 TaxID=2067452 RepID=UPI0020B357C3|nr:zinc-binding alcohol dehydrogenase [Tabrizicola sp. TH137]